jgi:hypothetical protein
MVEAPVPAGETDAVTGEGTGIRIVVNKEHLGDVLMTGDT